MGLFVDRAAMTVSGTPGVGTITLASAYYKHQTFAAAGVTNGQLVAYVIEDGASWEVGKGTYSSSGPTLARTTIYFSSNSNAAINASSSAVVSVTLTAEDIGPAGSSGYVQFNNAGAWGSSSNLFWDSANNRLGIGTASPSSPLDVVGLIRSTASNYSQFVGLNAGNDGGVSLMANGNVLNTSDFLVAQQGSTSNAFVYNRANAALIFGSNNTERMRIDASGSVGINTTTAANIQLYLGGTAPSSGASSYSYYTNQTIPSTSTNIGSGYATSISTAAASFTCISLTHFAANQGTFGAGSAVTNQYGFYASANLVGAASNNFGYWSGIPSGAGRWNFYAAGTADNYFAGRVGIGTTPTNQTDIYLGGSATGNTTQYGVLYNKITQSDVLGQSGFSTSLATAAAAFTLTEFRHFNAAFNTIGAGSTVTNQYGFYASSGLNGATNNYGFYGNIAAASGRYNFYAFGTAANWFSGDVLVFGAGGLGYTTGSGGTITQATSRTTGVTLNKTNGAITLVSAAGSATYQTFTVTNSAVAATDTVILNQKSGTDKYILLVTNVASGSFQITFATTGGTTTEQPVISFAVIKAVTA